MRLEPLPHHHHRRPDATSTDTRELAEQDARNRMGQHLGSQARRHRAARAWRASLLPERKSPASRRACGDGEDRDRADLPSCRGLQAAVNNHLLARSRSRPACTWLFIAAAVSIRPGCAPRASCAPSKQYRRILLRERHSTIAVMSWSTRRGRPTIRSGCIGPGRGSCGRDGRSMGRRSRVARSRRRTGAGREPSTGS